MSAEPVAKKVKRTFEQPSDSITCYAELSQTVATEHEILISFYEPIPGPPTGPSGEPNEMRARLRATIVLNKPHAAKLAATLIKAGGGWAGQPDTSVNAE